MNSTFSEKECLEKLNYYQDLSKKPLINLMIGNLLLSLGHFKNMNNFTEIIKYL